MRCWGHTCVFWGWLFPRNGKQLQYHVCFDVLWTVFVLRYRSIPHVFFIFPRWREFVTKTVRCCNVWCKSVESHDSSLSTFQAIRQEAGALPRFYRKPFRVAPSLMRDNPFVRVPMIFGSMLSRIHFCLSGSIFFFTSWDLSFVCSKANCGVGDVNISSA